MEEKERLHVGRPFSIMKRTEFCKGYKGDPGKRVEFHIQKKDLVKKNFSQERAE